MIPGATPEPGPKPEPNLCPKGYPAVQAKQVGQENRIAIPDCSVLVGGTA